MKLTILVPVYNEEKTILQVLNQLLSLNLPCNKEIIVVDDGSTDKTKRYIKKITNRNLKKIFHSKNYGKGKTIQTGLKVASGDYILIQDADLEYNPDEIPKLLSPLELEKRHNKSKLIAVYGSRFKNKDAVIPILYLFGNKLLTLLTNILYGTHLSDMETGFKLLPAIFLNKNVFQSTHFDFEPEVTAKLIKSKIKIVEIPITYKGRSHLAGKKLTAVDAFGAIKTLLYYRFF